MLTWLQAINSLYCHPDYLSESVVSHSLFYVFPGKRTGSVSAASRSGRFVGDDDYLPCINAMDIDFTDSFLMVGDEMGELQVWDISQIFDDHHDPTMSLIIDAFRWKAHEQAVTRVQHLRKVEFFGFCTIGICQ